MSSISPRQTIRGIYKPDYYKQGALFEDYVRLLFNQNSFYLRKWRKSGTIPKDASTLEYSYPDLELNFGGKNRHPFAVECKWRSRFRDGKISWAKKEQISRYVDFQNKTTMPVFVAIGVGGLPNNPEKLFVIPLNNIQIYTDVYENKLGLFKRNPKRRFYYNTAQLKLF